MKLHLERDNLYYTYDNILLKCKRSEHAEPLDTTYSVKISNTRKPIIDFVKKEQTIFAASANGKCFISENGITTKQRLHPSKEVMQCVDFSKNLYATSSDFTTRLRRRTEKSGQVHLDLAWNRNNSCEVLRFTADAQHVFGGLSSDPYDSALRQFNVETGQEQVLNSETVSIYDIKLKDENVIFTVNFDPTFRMHDRRVNKDVAIWEDPHYSESYCLEYDGLNAVLCGTKYGGRVNLYDIREPNKCVQSYSTARVSHNRGLPKYNIACDSHYLFVPSESYISVLDFKGGDPNGLNLSSKYTQVKMPNIESQHFEVKPNWKLEIFNMTRRLEASFFKKKQVFFFVKNLNDVIVKEINY